MKNQEFKKIFYGLTNGTIARRFATELIIEEEAIYKFYTNNSYYEFNQALINQSKSEEVLALETLLNKTIEKVPSSPGVYFRGIGKDELERILSLGKNNTITYNNFLSSSIKESQAANFVKSNREKTGVGAWVEVVSKTGKSISKYSDAGFEAEILHKSRTSCKIKSIEFKEKLVIDSYEYGVGGVDIEYFTTIKNVYKIILEEL